MFQDSLVESSGRLAARNPWTTAVSFTLQIAACGVLVLLSLLYTDTLPSRNWIEILQAPPPPPAAPVRIIASGGQFAARSSAAGALVVPREVPKNIDMRPDKPVATTGAATPPLGIVGAIPTEAADSGLAALRTVMPVTPRLVPQKLRVSSGVAEGMLVHQVKPQYPTAARLARIEGRVMLQAIIARDGTVENLRVISGHPMLVPAAIDAVKQWRYKPYYLNDKPIEVETQIVVNFVLSGN